jgi:hypothetical protein
MNVPAARSAGMAVLLVAGLQAPGGPAQTPLQRLQASIERTTRSVNATWGIWIKSLETLLAWRCRMSRSVKNAIE